MQKKAVIGGTAAAAVVIGLGAWWTVENVVGGEITERGVCGNASWQFSAEGEDGGTEVSAELQSAAPGEVWQVELLRGDTALLSGTRTTDEDGEIDVDAFTSGNPRDGVYTFTFTPATGQGCTATIGD